MNHKWGQTFLPLKAHTQSLSISALQPCSSPLPGWCVAGATAKLCNSAGSTDRLQFLSGRTGFKDGKWWWSSKVAVTQLPQETRFGPLWSGRPPLFLHCMCPHWRPVLPLSVLPWQVSSPVALIYFFWSDQTTKFPSFSWFAESPHQKRLWSDPNDKLQI